MTFERQKPLWWELAKALLIAAVAIAAFSGCQSLVNWYGGHPTQPATSSK